MSLRTIDFVLELEDEAALTAFAATVGNHETLPYIPGACLMGYLAGKLYKDLTNEESRRLFHGDQVRFGDARILNQKGEPVCPSPKTWFYAKSLGKPLSGSQRDRLDRGRLQDRLLDPLEPELRYKEFTGGEICIATGRLFDPRRSYRQGTAINPEANRAAEGQLFGYESLESGQRLGGRILFAAGVDEKLYKKVRNHLAETSFFVGRSRSAQYGRVKCLAKAGSLDLALDDQDPKKLSLWLLSDLSAWDDRGQPSLWPRPDWLGLPPGALVEDQTYLATRRYSPWNGYARSRDRERLVISRGSVLTFQITGAWTDTHREQLTLGLGGYLAYGLGETAVYPPDWQWAGPPGTQDEEGTESDPTLRHDPEPPGSPDGKANDYATALLDWIKITATTDRESVDQALSELGDLYERYRRLHGLTPEDQEGPRKTHWAEVERIATVGEDVAGELKELPKVWEDSRYGPEETDHFAHWVQQRAKEPELLARIAAEARRRNIMGER